jgi:metacaspase-1
VAILPTATPQKYPALLAAGCKDPEYSYDASFNGRPNGAFTRVAIDALRKNPATPKAWMTDIRTKLPTEIYPQTPSLYGSRTAKRGPIL